MSLDSSIEKALQRFYADNITREIPDSLPLVEEFAKQQLSPAAFDDIDVLFIQHQLGPFIGRLRSMMAHGLEYGRCWFVDIPYSTNHEVNNAIKALGCPEEQMVRLLDDPIAPYSRRQRERVEYLVRLLGEKEGKKRLLVIDDGAYFVRTLNHLMQTDGKLVASFKERGTYIVEQTTRGHRYLQEEEAGITALKALNFPVVSIARSRTKDALESPFIGAAVSRAMRNALEKRRGSDGDKPAILVIGFGPVGRATAIELVKELGISPDVYDKAWRRLSKDIEGIKANPLKAIPHAGSYDVVLGCTGYASFPPEKVGILANGALLVSGSSAAVEFNREGFIDRAYAHDDDDFYVVEPERTRKKGIHAPIMIHKDNKRFSFANAGFPVNFDGGLECLPAEIIQSTHGLLLAAAAECLEQEPGFHQLNELQDNWMYTRGLDYIRAYAQ